jgi:hypothetical protein
VINVLVRELAPLDRFLAGPLEATEAADAPVKRLPLADRPSAAPGEEEPAGADVASSMRAVAPPIQSFAAGRRR